MANVYPGWFIPRLFAPFLAQRLEAQRLRDKLRLDTNGLLSLDDPSKHAVIRLVEEEADSWARQKARNDFFVGLFSLVMMVPIGISVYWTAYWLLNIAGLISTWHLEATRIPALTTLVIFSMIALFSVWDSLRQRRAFREHLEIHSAWILIESLRALEQTPGKWSRLAFRRPLAERVQFLGHVVRVGFKSELPNGIALRLAAGLEALAAKIHYGQFDDVESLRAALANPLTAICSGKLIDLEQVEPNWLEKFPLLQKLSGVLIGGAIGVAMQKTFGFPEPYAALMLGVLGFFGPHFVADVVRKFRENKPQ